jgi:hypothetical protein
MDMPLMNKQQIIDNLKLLGEELAALELTQPVRLLMMNHFYSYHIDDGACVD